MKKQAINPYLPSWEYIPDGEPYVFGDRVYVYGSHDYYNGYIFCMGDYMCWSAPIDDLSDWRCEGVIYPRNADPMNANGEMCLYAPDVTVGPDGRYYLYYVLDKTDVVSVAVCDNPTGRYRFLGYVRYKDGTLLGRRKGDDAQFDPGVLTEGKKTYLYTGFCRRGSMCTVLGEDMLTVEQDPVFVIPSEAYGPGTCFENHAFFEASSIRKKGNTYYLIYSSQQIHELCYATSDRPDGGFVYGGVIVSNNDVGIGTYKKADLPMAYGGNNHGSIVEINGQWYIFYHRHTNGSWYSRQGCIEPITFTQDGAIPQVEITSSGPNLTPLKGEGEYPAYIACNLYTPSHDPISGVPDQPRVMQDGRDDDKETGYVGNIKDGATIGFKYFDIQNVKAFSIWTRCSAGGKFELRTSPDGEVLCEIDAGWENVWKKHTAKVELPKGKQSIYLTYRGGRINQIHLKSIVFETEE